PWGGDRPPHGEGEMAGLLGPGKGGACGHDRTGFAGSAGAGCGLRDWLILRQGIYGWEETMTTTEPAQNETVPDIGASIIRTLVPLLVGALVALGSRYLAVELPVDALEEIVTVVVAGIYYTVARFLEERVSPAWG